METLELYDIDEDQLRGLLHQIPEVWKKNSGFFDTGLKLVFRNFGESDNLIFGVHLFSNANGARIFIILTEYIRDARIASFNINVRNTTGWFAPSTHNSSELKFREMLEKLTYEELDKFSLESQYQESDEIFVCPNCSAQYLMRVLRVSRDGRVKCQNCLSLVDPTSLGVSKRVPKQNDSTFVCPNCLGQFSMSEVLISKDGELECPNCESLFDPVELDIEQRTASHDS